MERQLAIKRDSGSRLPSPTIRWIIVWLPDATHHLPPQLTDTPQTDQADLAPRSAFEFHLLRRKKPAEPKWRGGFLRFRHSRRWPAWWPKQTDSSITRRPTPTKKPTNAASQDILRPTRDDFASRMEIGGSPAPTPRPLGIPLR